MDRSIETLIAHFSALEPEWKFLLASGYEGHHESEGQKYFCHFTDPDFSMRRHNTDENHVFAFGKSAFEAFDRALEKLIARMDKQ